MTKRLLLSIVTLLLLIIITNTQAAINETEPKCEDGLMVPCWHPIVDLTLGDKIARGFVYFISLFYLFIGVSIISDRFMGAIEVITSQEREITVRKRDGEKQIIVVRVWNETVANLTLMALGSSAPEILLSIIEICAKNFQAGDLGPSTIVGSAAYNLYVIIALCVSVIPNGQVRRIKHLRVFFVTATWSIFAYVWLYLILAVISPGVLEVWEGLLTFSFFPLTVFTAYAADQRLYYKYLKKRFRMNKRGVIVQAEADDGSFELGRSSFTGDEVINNDDIRQEYINALRELRKQNPSFDLDTLKRMAHEELLNRGHKSRAFYRIQATRRLMGSGDVLRRISERALSDLSDVKSDVQKEPENEQNADHEGRTVAVVSKIFFDPYHYTVIESCKKFQVRVVRSGNLQMPCSVEWTTEDGSATAGTDYIEAKGVLHFNANESEKFITLEVIDDDLFEQDEHFFVRLLKAKHPGIVIPPAVASVIILDDDHAGVFQFFQRDHDLVESVGLYELKVQRCTGARGKIVLPFWTEDGTAKKNKEYEPQEGELVFENNESEKSISLRIIEEDSYEKDVLFYVQLGEPRMDDELAKFAENAEKKRPELRSKIEKLAILGKPRLGDITRAQIRIKESKEFKNTVDKLVQRANASLLIGTNTWKEQFIEAITVSAGSDDDSDGNTKSPSCTDYVMHFLTLFWKIVFAFVPPTSILRGYLTFFVSIVCIGVVTAIIGDVASHFGWTLGIKDSVTAVIFVALGTSVPDTFASKVAAIQDKYADASIGNVTGSNAVNVFLGIGIAWSMAAIYHEARGNQFIIDPGNLAFSVTLFCSGAVITIAVLLIRRLNCIGGELGGPVYCKYFTSVILMSLWIFYLVASSLEAYHVIKGF